MMTIRMLAAARQLLPHCSSGAASLLVSGRQRTYCTTAAASSSSATTSERAEQQDRAESRGDDLTSGKSARADRWTKFLLSQMTPVDQQADDFKSLIKNDADAKMVHLILLEVQAAREAKGQVPPVIEQKHMAELMQLPSPTRRTKYMHYMFKSFMSNLDAAFRKNERQRQRESMPKKPKKVERSLCPINPSQQEHLYYYARLATAAMFSQKLVIDCSFEHTMSRKELSRLGSQITMSYSSNRTSRDPFDLILTDVLKDGEIDTIINTRLPQMDLNKSLITKSYDSFLDMYPPDRLVYLSPNSPNILHTLDDDAIYVMGAIVDRSHETPLTLTKAMRQKIRHAKLPISSYLHYNYRSSLAFTLNVVLAVLLKYKETNNWVKAFGMVPRGLRLDPVRSKFASKKQSHRPKRTFGSILNFEAS